MSEKPSAYIMDLTGNILRLLGEEARITVDEGSDGLTVAVELDEPGPLIGKEGRGLDALQFIVYRCVQRKYYGQEFPSFTIDINGYRKRREQSLEQMARDIAERVRHSGESILLEPMNAWERRVVHIALRNTEDLATESEDTDEGRRVRIIPLEEETEEADSENDEQQG